MDKLRICSYSRLAVYDGCPQAYKLRYVDNVPEEPSESLMEGAVVHRAIAEYHRHLIAHGLESDPTSVEAIARLAWESEPHALPTDRLAGIVSLMESFARTHALDVERVVGVEEWFRDLEVADASFRGIRDKVEIRGRVGIVTDYKTDWQVRPQAEVDRDLQLGIYGWATLKEYPQLDKVVGVLDFVRHNVQREVEIDRERAEKVEAEIASAIRRIRADTTFRATPGNWCSWCSYTGRCPAAAAVKAEGRVVIATSDDAARVAAELILLEKQVSDRKKALQAYCNIHGDVVVNGVRWGFTATESKTVRDVAAYIDALGRLGLDLAECLRPDADVLKELLETEEYARELGPLLVDRSYTRFGSRKVKGVEAP